MIWGAEKVDTACFPTFSAPQMVYTVLWAYFSGTSSNAFVRSFQNGSTDATSHRSPAV